MKAVLKIITIVIGAIITINGIALFFVSNINLGNFLTVILGIVILLLALKFQTLGKLSRNLLITGVLLGIIFSSFLIIYGKKNTVTYKEDAVIVLGAAVHGKTPSLTLKKRLDTATEYHKKNPDAIIIVSGGKGAEEDITEAEAMETYLINKGVNTDKIIKEDKATSTGENFVFSKEILNEYFEDDYTTCFITNEYHILRSTLCAKRVGIRKASHLHSNTNLSYLISGSLRECLAVAKYAIFKN